MGARVGMKRLAAIGFVAASLGGCAGANYVIETYGIDAGESLERFHAV